MADWLLSVPVNGQMYLSQLKEGKAGPAQEGQAVGGSPKYKHF